MTLNTRFHLILQEHCSRVITNLTHSILKIKRVQFFKKFKVGHLIFYSHEPVDNNKNTKIMEAESDLVREFPFSGTLFKRLHKKKIRKLRKCLKT